MYCRFLASISFDVRPSSDSIILEPTNAREWIAGAMYIWNVIRAWFQERIGDMGVEEANFPMFLSAKSLEKVSGCHHELPTSRYSLTGTNFEIGEVCTRPIGQHRRYTLAGTNY